MFLLPIPCFEFLELYVLLCLFLHTFPWICYPNMTRKLFFGLNVWFNLYLITRLINCYLLAICPVNIDIQQNLAIFYKTQSKHCAHYLCGYKSKCSKCKWKLENSGHNLSPHFTGTGQNGNELLVIMYRKPLHLSWQASQLNHLER